MFFFKQKTAYELRISDWSSDVCSSDLPGQLHVVLEPTGPYHEQAGTALHDVGATVSMINPAQARDFARALAVRSKTDGIDSYVLAQTGRASCRERVCQ